MFYRCANYVFGYCSDEPNWDIKPRYSQTEDCYREGHCHLSPKTCGKYLTFLQDLRRQVDKVKDRLDNWAEFESVKQLVTTLEKSGN